MGQPYLAVVNAVEYPADVFCQSLRGADLAVLTNTRFARPLLPHARRLGVPVAVDVHLIADVDDAYNKPWLEVADVIFCSHERLKEPTPGRMDQANLRPVSRMCDRGNWLRQCGMRPWIA